MGFLSLSLLIVLLFFYGNFKMGGEFRVGYFVTLGIYELNNIFKSNMLLRKQIFFGYLISLFGFILFSNVLGMVPYNVTVSSYFVLSFFFSLITFMSVTLVGVRYHKVSFFKVLLPEGIPYLISMLLIIIELVSYVSRVLSLAIRLFANMTSGHTLLKILLVFAWVIITTASIFSFIGSSSLIVIFVVVLLEIIIAFLQAYIFIVLSSIYFNDVINLH
jgi:ATP synthase subunit 6